MPICAIDISGAIWSVYVIFSFRGYRGKDGTVIEITKIKNKNKNTWTPPFFSMVPNSVTVCDHLGPKNLVIAVIPPFFSPNGLFCFLFFVLMPFGSFFNFDFPCTIVKNNNNNITFFTKRIWVFSSSYLILLELILRKIKQTLTKESCYFDYFRFAFLQENKIVNFRFV